MRFRRTSELLDSHYRIHFGCYFDSIAVQEDAVLATSTIGGGIWNHRWIRTAQAIDLDSSFPNSDVGHVYIDSASDFDQTRYLVFDREAWMLFDPSSHNFTVSPDGLDIHEAKSDQEFDALFALVGASFSSSHASAIAASRRRKSIVRRRYYIAKKGGEALGAFSIHHLGRWAAVHDICVHPNQRCSGIGTSLLKAIGYRVPKGGVTYLACEDNQLVHFYINAGWKVIHRRIGLCHPSITSPQ